MLLLLVVVGLSGGEPMSSLVFLLLPLISDALSATAASASLFLASLRPPLRGLLSMNLFLVVLGLSGGVPMTNWFVFALLGLSGSAGVPMAS